MFRKVGVSVFEQCRNSDDDGKNGFTHRMYHRLPIQTEKSQPEGKRIIGNEVSGIIRWPEGWDFSVSIGDQCLIISLTYDIQNY